LPDPKYAVGGGIMAWDIRGSDGSIKSTIVGAGAAYSARAKRTTAQSIPNATWTAIAFTAEDFDTAGLHDNSVNNTRFTAPVSGVYDLSASCPWLINLTSDRLGRLVVDGTTTIAYTGETTTSHPGTGSATNLSTKYYLNAGQYVEFQVYQLSGAALDTGIYGYSGTPWMAMTLEQTTLVPSTIFDVCRLGNSTNTSLTSGANTLLSWDTPLTDTNGLYSNASPTRITIKRPGMYIITGTAEFAANATDNTLRQVGIRLNGGNFISLQRSNSMISDAEQSRVQTFTIHPLLVGDYVDMFARQDSGGALNVTNAASYSPRFSVAMIGTV